MLKVTTVAAALSRGSPNTVAKILTAVGTVSAAQVEDSKAAAYDAAST